METVIYRDTDIHVSVMSTPMYNFDTSFRETYEEKFDKTVFSVRIPKPADMSQNFTIYVSGGDVFNEFNKIYSKSIYFICEIDQNISEVKLVYETMTEFDRARKWDIQREIINCKERIEYLENRLKELDE